MNLGTFVVHQAKVFYYISRIKPMIRKKQLKKFHVDGYFKFKVKNINFLKEIKKAFIETIKIDNRQKKNLERNYHKIFISDALSRNNQLKFQRYILKKKIHYELIKNYREYFHNLLGLDICVTTSVNFRISRPQHNNDNLSYHRDTDLGHTPYELNVWVPLFDTDKKNTIKILPKSHLHKLNKYKFKKIKTFIEKGSKENRLGYLYKKFKFFNLNEKKLKPIDCKFGEILIFYSSCMHGTTNNTSNKTRFSLDFNISNSFFPIKWKHHGKEKKYHKLLNSQISINAKKILMN